MLKSGLDKMTALQELKDLLVKQVTPQSVVAAKQRGLVPQSGDWNAPYRWVKPREQDEDSEDKFSLFTDEAKRVQNNMGQTVSQLPGIEEGFDHTNPINANTLTREAVKRAIVNRIADRLAEMIAADDSYILATQIKERYAHKEGMGAYYEANYLVGQWAETSADSNSTSVALQFAARDEFGLYDVEMGHFNKDALQDARPEYVAYQDLFRAFHRAQYEITQEWFNEHGITHVTLYRGSALPKSDVSREDTHRPDRSSWMMNFATQPISSFSTDIGTAIRFAYSRGKEERTLNSPETISAVSVIRVPIEEILSTAVTGQGCLAEGEVIVLGGARYGMFFDVKEMWYNMGFDRNQLGSVEGAASRISQLIDERFANA